MRWLRQNGVQTLLLLFVLLLGLTAQASSKPSHRSQGHRVQQRQNKRSRAGRQRKESKLATCGDCQTKTCAIIQPDNCKGNVVKDDCGCCLVCKGTLLSSRPRLGHKKDEACKAISCPKSQMCVLNIQGIPMCRCPTLYLCRPRMRKEVCGRNGITYKSRCHLRVAECSSAQKIRVAYKGPCVKQESATVLPNTIITRRPRPLKRRKNKKGKNRRKKRRPRHYPN